MKFTWKLVGVGTAAVLCFDTLASVASLKFGFPYAYASVGSILIYAALGFTAFRSGGISRSICVALLVESADATLGWWLSWQIGPGELPVAQRTITFIAVDVLFVFAVAIICALIGAGISRMAYGPRQQTAICK